MSSGKATAFFLQFDRINSVLFSLLKICLEERGELSGPTSVYLDDLQRYSYLRKQNLLEADSKIVEDFSFDLPRLESEAFQIRPDEARLSRSTRFSITHNPRQRELITQYAGEFGHSFDGLGKMLMRYPHLHRLFRSSQPLH